MRNREVADLLYEIADLLELKGVEWKPRAYRRAAQNIESHSEDIDEVHQRGGLTEIAGVGESIAKKIGEYLETGQLQYLQNLRKEQPVKLRSIMHIEGVGPKTAERLHEELGITTIDELEQAAKDGKIRELKGFGEKSEQDILDGIQMYRERSERFILGFMLPAVKSILEQVREQKDVDRAEVAGSVRRRRATIGDMDLLVVSNEPEEILDFFVAIPEVKAVLSRGSRKSTVVLSNNLQVDLLVIKEENFGAALLYFTGSKSHNIELRRIAKDQGWKLSEYGLEERDTGKRIASKTEPDIYEKLGLKYIRPELREQRGEIEAARNDELPDVVEFNDLRGDLHVHSNWSEGENSIEEMATRAKEMGYEYIALTDHTESLAIAQGLDEQEFEERQKEIRQVNDLVDDFTVVSGAEVNIDSEGRLDLSSDILDHLGYVVAAIHSGFGQSQRKLTERTLSAIHNEYVHAIAHPTGRLIQKRDPLPLDMGAIYQATEDQGKLLEINAFPTRLDLSDGELMRAREYDIAFSLGTDSHSVQHLRYMEIGVSNAQRGWIEKDRVVNRLDHDELRSILD